MKSKNLIVAGTPGALINLLNRYLEQSGWSVIWPGQDLDIYCGKLCYENDCQNIEMHNVHNAICFAANVNFFSLNLPVYYDVPYPGPVEIASKFDTPAIFSSIYLPPFLDIWRPVADNVINIHATEAEDLTALEVWTQGSYTRDYLQQFNRVYSNRYRQHLNLFPKVFTITNAEIMEKRFSILNRFLQLLP